MDINLARKLDCLIGVPICFLLSLFDNFKKVFFPAERSKNVVFKKILFLGLSEIGSAILTYPAIKTAQKTYSQAELFFCIFKENQEAVRMLNIIKENNIFSLRNTNCWQLCIDTLRCIWLMKRKKIDAVIDIELFSRFSAILSYLSGARARSGFYQYEFKGLYRGDLHTHKVAFNPYLHISKNFISLVCSLKECPKQVPLLKSSILSCNIALPREKDDNNKKEVLWSRLRMESRAISSACKIVILNPDLESKLPLRRWPKKNYEELIKRLLLLPDVFVITIGIGCTEFCFDMRSDRYVDLTGKTTVRELIVLFGISSLFISHDSGAAHLASLTDINIVCIFGPETPVLYQPLSDHMEIVYSRLACSPCFSPFNYRRSICKDNRCLKVITIEEVYNKAKKYL